ncbi:MAG: linear amide C-N hydrolase [Desulfomonilaceae bacterium]
MTRQNIFFRVCLITLGLITLAGEVQSCMWFTLRAGDGSTVVGRTMEFGVPLPWQIVVVPRDMLFKSLAPNGRAGLSWKTKYGFVGYYGAGPEGAVADGMNEAGLAIGALWYEPYTTYQEVKPGQEPNSLDLTLMGPWILGNFSNVDELRKEIRNVIIYGSVVKELDMVPPLHVAVTDSSGKTIVLEFEKGNLNIFDSPLGILTNAPNFPWQMTNLRQFVGMDNANHKHGVMDSTGLIATGHGAGMFGVPGDMTPPSRFVRLALTLKSVIRQSNIEKTLNLAQHIVNSFDISRGLVVEKSKSGKITSAETTQFASFKDLKNRVMYQKTYDNLDVTKVDLKKLDFKGNKVKYMPLNLGPQNYQDITSEAR